MTIIKNTLWNLSGYVIPSIIAIPALGSMARLLGPEKFGLFTLAIALVGYASIFDAGLTRAVIREVSMHRHNKKELDSIIANSTIILITLGLVGATLIFFLSHEIVNLLNVEISYKQETIVSISLISITIPIFLLNQIWLAFFEGQEKFKQVNLIKSVNNSLLAGLPALFCIITTTLISAVTGLIIARIISLIVTFYFCRKDILSAGLKFERSTVKRLLSFGGWITISNVISPIMTYMDRFIISHLSGASKVAFYSAPSEGIQRLSILPSALSRTIFPKLSSNNSDTYKTKRQSYILMTLCLFPLCTFICIFSHFIMTTWMGEEFSGDSVIVLKILSLGFFLNCLAQIPFANIQARGFSKITAYIHLCELIPYLVLLFIFINKWGVVGAACAWSLRTTTDFIILFSIDHNIEKHREK